MSSDSDRGRRERDRRQFEGLGTLEALLLGVMKEKDVLTVHRLFAEMGLSHGSTTRALQRLVQQGLARKEADEYEGGRKTAFSITEKGDLKLKEMWESGVTRGPRTLQDVLITIALAKLLADPGKLKESIRALRDLAGVLRVRADNLLSRASQDKSKIAHSVAAQYGLWHAIYEAGRMRGEGDALEEIVNMLEAGPEFAEGDDLRDE